MFYVSLAYWFFVSPLYCYLGLELYKSIIYRNWWPEHCANIAAWKTYFKENVAGSWIHYDGQGF